MIDAAAIDTLTQRIEQLIAMVQALSVSRSEGKRLLSLNAAAKAYGTDAKKLRMLFDAGRLRGREVPGRGRSGKELRLSTQSLDVFFGISA